ncbi:MAG: serpin family protein, partial [Synergistetes bacterium]|nr:serpin family protein [Synergistota bacterium]
DYREHLQEAMERINKWVSEKTNGKVARIIRKGDIDRLVRLVLTDAIYFKGLWNFQFDKECTKEQEFHALGGKSVKVQMMSQRGRFLYYEDKIIQAVALPYAGMHFSMLILLPKPEVNIKVLEDRLSLEYLQSIRKEMSREIVRLYLPKFKLNERYYLKDVLYSMGMKDAFTKRADFSGMTGNKKLKISKVIHQAHVDVNEFGTEAAAATAVVMKLKAATPIGKVFRFDANRPFVFMVIHSSTGSILFVGRLANPS